MRENLSVVVDKESVWLRFCASNGKEALINVIALANSVHGPITSEALRQWCEDRRREQC